ncbi:MAG: hypothetical protein AVDCRST_MAG50-1395, partial [uncultured Acidimicrobiales bacterium]
ARVAADDPQAAPDGAGVPLLLPGAARRVGRGAPEQPAGGSRATAGDAGTRSSRWAGAQRRTDHQGHGPAEGARAARTARAELRPGRGAHRRSGGRLPGTHPGHVRVTAAREDLPQGRPAVHRGSGVHQRHVPQPQGHQEPREDRRGAPPPVGGQGRDRQDRHGGREV